MKYKLVSELRVGDKILFSNNTVSHSVVEILELKPFTFGKVAVSITKNCFSFNLNVEDYVCVVSEKSSGIELYQMEPNKIPAGISSN